MKQNKGLKEMTEDEFKKAWLRESKPEPGVFLDVQPIEGLSLTKAA